MKKYVFSLLVCINFIISCNPKQESPAPCDNLTKVDREMLDLVELIEKEYMDDKDFIVAFRDAQVYWTQYRNRQVKAVYPSSPRKYAFDVGACKCEVMAELTRARVQELKKWTDGVEANQCLGTYKEKRN